MGDDFWTNPGRLRVAVVGSGAIGAWYGAALDKAGHDVRFLFRSDYDVVVKQGLTLIDQYGERENRAVQAYRGTEEIGPVDAVLIAAKATANTQIAELLPPLLDEHTMVATLQNGLGNIEFFGEAAGHHRMVGILCFVCLNRLSPGVIHNILPGYLNLGEPSGPVSSRVQVLAEAFNAGGIKARTSDSLNEALWRKLCWNIPFNGLAIAGGGLRTDAVLSNPRLRELCRLLMVEVQHAARAEGHEIEDSFLDRQFTLTEPMGPYAPSSLLDFENGQPVELNAIWEEPLRRGQELGVPMPYLQTLTALLSSLVARS